MNILRDVAGELFKMFVGDAQLAVGVLTVVSLTGLLTGSGILGIAAALLVGSLFGVVNAALIAGLGISSFVATCSLWPDAASIAGYAFDAPGAHPAAISKDHAKPFHHEEAFIRLTMADMGWPAMLPASDALEAWVAEHGRSPAGPLRQVLIADQRTADPDTPVCDLAIPLR